MSADGIRVLKFGGSSVADPAVMRRAAMVATAALSRDGRPGSGPGVVVVSALGGVTRELVAIADDALAGLARRADTRIEGLGDRHRAFLDDLALGADESGRIGTVVETRLEQLRAAVREAPTDVAEPGAFTDGVLAFGELLASVLFHGVLSDLGMRCRWVDAREVLLTDARFRSAAPDLDSTRNRAEEVLRPILQGGESVVVPGFIGATADGRTTTMGFEASDLTATVLGAALEAREVQIWTDVSGVLSADPRVVAEPVALPHLSYGSARELAVLGARVLHPDTTRPARGAGIRIRVMNCGRPADHGTVIDATGVPVAERPQIAVTARASQVAVSVRVAEDVAEPVLAFLRATAARRMFRDVLFARRALDDGTVEVTAVAGNATDAIALDVAAQTFGTTSYAEAVSAVSVVACDGSDPEWPLAEHEPVRWDGLRRARGVIVPDSQRDALVRAAHERLHQVAAPVGARPRAEWEASG